MGEFLQPLEARRKYGLRVNDLAKENEIERVLRERGIAAIEMPLTPDDFKRFSDGFAVVLDEFPGLLKQTFHKSDYRYGGEAGYVRKERKLDESTGLQTADPKNYFHFTETARDRWHDEFAKGPKIMREFLQDGYEIQDVLLGLAKGTIDQLENTHPNMPKLYFPSGQSLSVLRLLRYDSFKADKNLSEVAKPHFDIGGLTIQAYADAPGFWAAKDGVNGRHSHYDTGPGEAYAFMGKGHEKVYGQRDDFKPLWHGVDRIVPAGVSLVPERTAVILFVDAPEVDYRVSSRDTLPQLIGQAATVRV